MSGTGWRVDSKHMAGRTPDGDGDGHGNRGAGGGGGGSGGGGGGGGGGDQGPALARGGLQIFNEVFKGTKSKPAMGSVEEAFSRPYSAVEAARAIADAAEEARAMEQEAASADSKVNTFMDLETFLRQKEESGIHDRKWIDMNRKLAAFIAGVASVNPQSSAVGRQHASEPSWPRQFAYAVQARKLDEKGQNLESVITLYAPGVISTAILHVIRELHVVRPEYDRYSLWDFIRTSVEDPRNPLAGVFKTLVMTKIQQLAPLAGHRGKEILRTRAILLGQLQSSCGGLSLEKGDCPSTLGR